MKLILHTGGFPQDDETAGLGGSCNVPCPQCQSRSDQLCKASTISNASACSSDSGNWSEASSSCYKKAVQTITSGSICPPNYESAVCDSMDRDACNDPACFWNDQANCASQSVCEQSGKCDDASYGNREDCESQQTCMYNAQQSTDILADRCKSDCNSADYVWRSVNTWYPGVWSAATPAVTREWTNRTTVSKSSVPKEAFPEYVRPRFEKAVARIIARDIVSEAYCKTDPLIDIFGRIGCASGVCTDNVTTQKIGKTKAFPNAGKLWRSTIGWISFKGRSDQDAGPAQDLVVKRLSSSDFAKIPGAVDPQDCTAFSRDALGFQIVGSGLVLDGVPDGDLTICLRTSPAVGVCIDNYPIADFAIFDRGALTPLYATVNVVDKTQELCGTVDTSRVAGKGIVPIRRLRTNYPPISALIKLSLNLPSKRLFTDARFQCLQAALSAAVGTGVSPADISAKPASIIDEANSVLVTMTVSIRSSDHMRYLIMY
jgi:hypothetical protein